MAYKQRLGKGLDALFPAEGAEGPIYDTQNYNNDEPSTKWRSREGSPLDDDDGQNAALAFTAGDDAVTADAGETPAGGANGSVAAGALAGGAGALAGSPPLEGGSALQTGGEILISLDRLLPNPDQPRRNFDEDALRELADSIKEHGVIEPPVVEDAGDGNWIIVAGERRVRAARLAGLVSIPVLVRAFTETERLEIALIENIQRADLNPVEEAAAYRRLMEISGLSQDEVAGRVGKNRSTVANTLRLLKLPQAIQEALASGTLSPGHGRALLSVTGSAEQEKLYRAIIDAGLSVREAEKRAAALNAGAGSDGALEASGNGGASAGDDSDAVESSNAAHGDSNGAAGGAAKVRDPELGHIEQRFIDTLGTKVVIAGDLSRGSIKIDYYSMDDLDRLLGIMGGQD